VLLAVSVALMAWDWHESFERIFFDTGAPLWPYEMPHVLLAILDAPALALSGPLLSVDEWWRIPVIYLVQLPFIAAWWWFLGTRLDFGLIGTPPLRRPRLLASFLIPITSLLSLFIGSEVRDYIFYWHYMKGHGWIPGWPMRFMQDTGAIVWSVVLSVLCLRAAKRLVSTRGESMGVG
jgi:hypothetical protein